MITYINPAKPTFLFCDEAQLDSVLLTDMMSNGMPDVDVSRLSIEHSPQWELLPNDVWTFIIGQLDLFDKLVRSEQKECSC